MTNEKDGRRPSGGTRGRARLVIGTALALFVLPACTHHAPRVRGTTLISGKASEIWVAPGGRVVATLVGAESSGVTGAPAGLHLGSLTVVDVAGGTPRRLGGGVSNLPGSLLYSSDGKVLGFIAEYDVKSASGELRLVPTAGGTVQTIADGVTFFGFSPHGDQLAYISNGDLYLRPPAGPSRRIASNVFLFQFGPKDTLAEDTLLIHRSYETDGALLSYDLKTAKLTAIAQGVQVFHWSPAGDALAFNAQGLLAPTDTQGPSVFGDKKRGPRAPGLYVRWQGAAPVRVTETMAQDFKLSPVGGRIAYATPPGFSTTGDLWVAGRHAQPKKVAEKVEKFQFGRDGSLAVLGAWVQSAEAGTLGLLPPTGPLLEVARSVRQVFVTPHGRQMLYLHGIKQGHGWALELADRPFGVARTVEPREIDTAISGYAFDASETHLAYKAHCMDSDTCELFVVDLTRPGRPVKLADSVAAFQYVPKANELAVIASREAGHLTGRMLYSLTLMPLTVPSGSATASMAVLDDDMTGEFAFAGPNKREVVYLVDEKGREGLDRASLDQPLQKQAAR